LTTSPSRCDRRSRPHSRSAMCRERRPRTDSQWFHADGPSHPHATGTQKRPMGNAYGCQTINDIHKSVEVLRPATVFRSNPC
jgi:hypothetical protein